MRSELEKMCESKRVKIDVSWGVKGAGDGFPSGSRGYRVTLRFRGHQLTTDFWQGPAIEKEPAPADVLYCLCSDVSGLENLRDFTDWCSEYGYDADSRRAEKIYKSIEAHSKKLHHFLGDSFETFCRAEH